MALEISHQTHSKHRAQIEPKPGAPAHNFALANVLETSELSLPVSRRCPRVLKGVHGALRASAASQSANSLNSTLRASASPTGVRHS
jgi:hypothetical protein